MYLVVFVFAAVCMCLWKLFLTWICQQCILQQPGGLRVCHHCHGDQSCLHNNGLVVMEMTGCNTNHHLYQCSQDSIKSSMGGCTGAESEKRSKPWEWQTARFLQMCVFSKYKYYMKGLKASLGQYPPSRVEPDLFTCLCAPPPPLLCAPLSWSISSGNSLSTPHLKNTYVRGRQNLPTQKWRGQD